MARKKEKISSEMKDAIYKDWLDGYEMTELKAKYNLTAAKINNYIMQREMEKIEEVELGIQSKRQKIEELSEAKLKRLNEELNESNAIIAIAERFGIDDGELVDYYFKNWYKNTELVQHRDRYRKEYFKGRSIKELKDDYEVFKREFAEVLDREAIMEDLRSGMTLVELEEVWGTKDLDDLTFSNNAKVDIGKRYSRKELLNIIAAELVKGR